MKRGLSCTFAAAVSALIMVSCGSVPKNTALSEQQNRSEVPFEADPSSAVSIAMPKREKSFFSGVSAEAVAAVENGSPQAIRKAWSLIRVDAANYSEQQKILLNVASSIMKIVWTSETSNMDSPSVSTPNPYMGAVDSARQGIYDLSTGSNDFLTIVLPSLVLVTSDSRNDYYGESRMALNTAIELNKDSVLALYLSGVLYRKTGDNEKALTDFQKAASLSSDTTEIDLAVADCLYKLERYQESLEIAARILEKDSYNKAALKLCAESSFALGKLDECSLYVARVLQQEPENSYYMLFRAKILIQKGDYIRAASLLDVYARTDSTSRNYLVLRAKVQKDWNKNTLSAFQTMEKALQLYPDDNEIILTAASLAFETRNPINGLDAGELAAQILEKEPDNVNALEIQVKELVQKKQWEKAYQVSKNLCQLKNSPSSAVFTHISICLSAGRKDEAWNTISSLYSKNPSDENTVQTYLKVLVSTGRGAEASRIIESQLPGANAKMKSFLLYERSFLAVREDAALTDLRSSLTANPRNKDALFRLYQIYFNKKEYRKAQYYLKQVVALSPSDDSLLKLNSELETLLSK